MSHVDSRYTDGTYLKENPEWDRQDSVWKANLVLNLLGSHRIHPKSVCELGCGTGDIIVHLKKSLTSTSICGFDVSPQLGGFWKEHKDAQAGVEFHLADFHAANKEQYDVLLICDVFEHVRDPFTFLENSRRHARYFVFHIPLDLSASAVARGVPLMRAREKVGHLHSYTKDLALATLRETGYEIVEWRYTRASLCSPARSIRTRAASLARRFAYWLHKDLGVRLLGGETLLVLATASKKL